jgi:hypothetical protein
LICRILTDRGRSAIFVSETPENCRKKAAACWRAASRVKDPDAKDQFRELAGAWLRLAERGERDPDWKVAIIEDKTTDDAA